MKENRAIIRKRLNVIEAFGIISFCLLIGLILVISNPSLGVARFNGASDVLAVMGLVLLFAVLAGMPAFALFYFLFQMYFGDSDIYNTAWLDGLMDSRLSDAPEVKKWLGE